MPVIHRVRVDFNIPGKAADGALYASHIHRVRVDFNIPGHPTQRRLRGKNPPPLRNLYNTTLL